MTDFSQIKALAFDYYGTIADKQGLGATIDQAGDELIEMIRRTANGRNTASEALGHREFSMTKLYRSA